LTVSMLAPAAAAVCVAFVIWVAVSPPGAWISQPAVVAVNLSCRMACSVITVFGAEVPEGSAPISWIGGVGQAAAGRAGAVRGDLGGEPQLHLLRRGQAGPPGEEALLKKGLVHDGSGALGPERRTASGVSGRRNDVTCLTYSDATRPVPWMKCSLSTFRHDSTP